jgi:hypothetical protein
MRIIFRASLFLTAVIALAAPAGAFPQFLLYQGQYLNNNAPTNGNISMEFRITKNASNVACNTSSDDNLFWTSGSTAVATSNGLFSYKVGLKKDGVTQDPAFSNINWALSNTTYYIDVCVLGAQLSPKEAIGATAFAMYSSYAATAGSIAGYCGLVCSGKCVDETVDPNHCGDCDTICSQGQVCSSGSCVTRAGATMCAGSYVNLQSNTSNCGSCGAACPVGGVHTSPACASGSCSLPCATGFVDCDNNKQSDGCEIDATTDPNNCGGCGSYCSSSNITLSCGSGLCNGNCTAGFADCDNNKRSNGCETGTTNDNNNCGACGSVCVGGATCTAGVCAYAQGHACASFNQCLTGHCADGYCCDTACSGDCNACSAAYKGSGSNGTCGFAAARTDPKSACLSSKYLCNGTQSSCPTSCNANLDCTGGATCLSNLCVVP